MPIIATEGSPQNPIIIDEDIAESLSSRRSLRRSKNPIDSSPTPMKTDVNKGMKLLLGMGYQPGSGLGKRNDGITEPVSVIPSKRKISQDDVSGIGRHPISLTSSTQYNIHENTENSSGLQDNPDEESQRYSKKRMTGENKTKNQAVSLSTEEYMWQRTERRLKNLKAFEAKKAVSKQFSRQASQERLDHSRSISVHKPRTAYSTTEIPGDNEALRLPTNASSDQNFIAAPHNRSESLNDTQKTLRSSSRRDTSNVSPFIATPNPYSSSQQRLSHNYNLTGRTDMQYEQIKNPGTNPYSSLTRRQRSTRFDMPIMNVPAPPSHRDFNSQSVQVAALPGTSQVYLSRAVESQHSSTTQTARPTQNKKPPIPPRKQIGVTIASSDVHYGGTFSPVALNGYRPDSSRTLTLDLIPKRCRNERFVQDWASEFTHNTNRLRIFLYEAKSLIEFASNYEAESAFNSPLMRNVHHKNVRAYWYIVSNQGTEIVHRGEISTSKTVESYASTNLEVVGSKTSNNFFLAANYRSGAFEKRFGDQRKLDHYKTKVAARPTRIIPGEAIRAVKDKQSYGQLQTMHITLPEANTASHGISATETERPATLPVSGKSISQPLLPADPVNAEADTRPNIINAEEERLPIESNTTTSPTRIFQNNSLHDGMKTYHAPVPSATGFRSGSLIMNRPADTVMEHSSSKNLTLKNPAQHASERVELENEISIKAPTASASSSVSSSHIKVIHTSTCTPVARGSSPTINAMAASQPEDIAVTAVTNENDPQEQIPQNRLSPIVASKNASDTISTKHSKPSLKPEPKPHGESNLSADAVVIDAVVILNNTSPCTSVIDSPSGVMLPEHSVSFNSPFNSILSQSDTASLKQAVSASPLMAQIDATESHIRNETGLIDKKIKLMAETVMIPQVLMSPQEQCAGDITTPSVNASIDDIAVAFITDAIRSASPSGHGTTIKDEISDTQTKSEIECRRARLEENIAQSSALLEQLRKAETRLERIEILEKIRGINRTLDSDMKRISNATLKRTQSADMKMSVMDKVSHIWPVEVPNGSMILDISDDESDNDN